MKKTAQNDITGDWMQSKPNSEQFEKNFDLIFRNKKEVKPAPYKIESPQLAEYELHKSTGEVIKKED